MPLAEVGGGSCVGALHLALAQVIKEGSGCLVRCPDPCGTWLSNPSKAPRLQGKVPAAAQDERATDEETRSEKTAPTKPTGSFIIAVHGFHST
jgi:hypothetical protein